MNQTVRLPRWRRAASYAAQFVTRCRCLGMRWRRAALALNGTAGVRGSWEGPLPYATRPLDATRTDPCTKVAMRMIAAPQRHLSRSWRFGEELAGVARAILAHTGQPPAVPLRGDPGIATTLGPVRPPCAVLCRTNAGLFEAAVRGRDRIHVVGGLEPLARLVLGGWGLYLGEPAPEVPALARFRGWDELLEEAEEGRDPELRFLVRVVAQYGRALPGLVADLRRRAAPQPEAADRVLATAHKAKGLEWPEVRLAADFPSLRRAGRRGPGRGAAADGGGAGPGAAPAVRGGDPGPAPARAEPGGQELPRRAAGSGRGGPGTGRLSGAVRLAGASPALARRPAADGASGPRGASRPVALALAGEAGEGAALVAQLDPALAAVALEAPPQPARVVRRRQLGGERARLAGRQRRPPRGRRRAGRAVPRAGRAVGAGGRPAGRPGCAAGPPPAAARRGPPPPPPAAVPWRSIASFRRRAARPSRCARWRASISRSASSSRVRSGWSGSAGRSDPAGLNPSDASTEFDSV